MHAMRSNRGAPILRWRRLVNSLCSPFRVVVEYVEVEYIRNPASAPSFASSSLSSYSTPSSSVDPAVMRQKAFETIQRVTPMIL